ncbi:MAG: YceI family protein [Planctomycetota bacterium]|nr:MAG: YceI family protein [Planctomycetota bacterium]
MFALVGTRRAAAAALTASLAFASTTTAQPSNVLEPPAEVAAKGTVFYVVPGKPGENIDQTRFTNTPPKSKKKVDFFTGFTNAIIGYAVSESEGEPAKLVAGEFHLPVKSLDTGIKGRNRHLQQKNWLWAKKHPEIVFTIKRTENIRPKSGAAGGKAFDATIVGDMTIRGQTKEMAIPAEIAIIDGGDKGQLMRIRATYSVKLSDFGVKNGIIGKRVADDIAIEQYLVLSTKKPA